MATTDMGLILDQSVLTQRLYGVVDVVYLATKTGPPATQWKTQYKQTSPQHYSVNNTLKKTIELFEPARRKFHRLVRVFLLDGGRQLSSIFLHYHESVIT